MNCTPIMGFSSYKLFLANSRREVLTYLVEEQVRHNLTKMEITVLVVSFISIPFICRSQSSADVNLAFNKTATQSTNDTFGAGNAVNGFLDDFSHTTSAGTQWWTVDLGRQRNIRRIEIYNKPGHYSGLADITVLIGHGSNLPDPSLRSNRWTNVSYHEAPYGSVRIVSLNPPISARHVAVLSSAGDDDMSLDLVEVEIYSSRTDYTKATGVVTYQSFTYNHSSVPHIGPSQYAIDDDVSTMSASKFKQNGWWGINLGRTILFSYAVVYARDGEDCSNIARCSDRLSNVYFLTNDYYGVTAPNHVGRNGWNVCNSSVRALGDNYTIRCNSSSSYLTPLTRQFVIMSFSGEAVVLREVQIFGYALPELGNSSAKVDASFRTSVSISFNQWNRDMIGGAPPTEYRVRINGTRNKSARIEHNRNISIQRQSGVTFSELSPGQTYDIEISCKIQDHSCSGDVYRFSVTTVACTDPALPKFHISSPAENLMEQDNITISLHLEPSEHNCRSLTQYNITITNTATDGIRRFMSRETGVIYISDLDTHTKHKISVVAINDEGLSSERVMFYLARETPCEIETWRGVGIAGAIVVGCAMLIFFFMLKKRGWGRSTAENYPTPTQDNEYTGVVFPGYKPDSTREEVELENYNPSDNQCAEFERTNIANEFYEELGDRPASTSDIYSKICGEGGNGGSYEVVDLQDTPDHLYAAIGN